MTKVAQGTELTEAACEYCGSPMRFQSSARGQKVECPHCGRAVVLGAEAPLVLEMRSTSRAHVQRLTKSKVRALTLYLGWPLFAAGFVALLSSLVTPLIGGDTASRALGLFLSLLATGVGLALMLESRHVQTYWICSSCAQKLPSRDVITCAGCSADLE